jgi:hypothetical protein
LLGDQPVLAPDAHLYQRLLAMDHQEARAVAEQYRKENSLSQLYDTVIIPALSMAEQDRHKSALDPEREEFLFMTVREMLAEFSEKVQEVNPQHSPGQSRPPIPGRILCLPANDEADEIAAAMLAQLLEHAGCALVSFPQGPSAISMLGVIEPAVNDICCVSAVPPFAFSHARTLSRELRAKFRRIKIVIGVWGFSGQNDRALSRFQPSPPDKFMRSLGEALEYLGVPTPTNEVEVSG